MTDLFEAAASAIAATPRQRAEAILRAMKPDRKGRLLGCISYLAKEMNVPYSMAWDMMDRLEAAGFITETDGHGRRTLVQP